MDQPNAIPYVTSYYKKKSVLFNRKSKKKLKDESYQVYIDTSFKEEY